MENRRKTLLIMLMTALSASLSAAPVGYSVNSDSPSELSDGLYSIDLETGTVIERIGTVQSTQLQSRIDVEGLALTPLAPDDTSTLYGIDDDSLKLFAISKENALIDPDKDYDLSGLSNGNNDFGMTFACDENLYVSSVVDQSLYRVGPEGELERVGGSEKGKLGASISALAAYGFPVQLYGLGNGTVGDQNVPSAPKLYLIDTITGVATEIDNLTGPFGAYESGGLAFDEAGNLWAMTDRRPLDLPSQVMQIDKSNGVVSNVNDVNGVPNEETWGFESLAISSPSGCTTSGNGQVATFFVQKRFTDGNNIAPVTVNFRCNGGTVFNGTKTLNQNEYSFGILEGSFAVDNVPQAPISCEVFETVPAGYTAEYSCQSETGCTTGGEVSHCVFTEVSAGQRNICLIDNNLAPVEITVTKEWNYLTPGQADEEDYAIDEEAKVTLTCLKVRDGDGKPFGKNMRWTWKLKGNPASKTATVYPRYDGKTECRIEETVFQSAVESENTCSDPFEVNVGDQNLECVVTNTIFFEGIPTLNPFGLALVTALMLLTGAVATRRFG